MRLRFTSHRSARLSILRRMGFVTCRVRCNENPTHAQARSVTSFIDPHRPRVATIDTEILTRNMSATAQPQPNAHRDDQSDSEPGATRVATRGGGRRQPCITIELGRPEVIVVGSGSSFGVACRIGATRSVSLGVSARLGLGDMIRLLAWTISSRGPFRFIGIYMFFRHFFRRVATHQHDRHIEHAESAEGNASKVPHRHHLNDMVESALPSSLEVQNATPRRVPIGDTKDDDECAATTRSHADDESEWSLVSHSVDSD